MTSEWYQHLGDQQIFPEFSSYVSSSKFTGWVGVLYRFWSSSSALSDWVDLGTVTDSRWNFLMSSNMDAQLHHRLVWVLQKAVGPPQLSRGVSSEPWFPHLPKQAKTFSGLETLKSHCCPHHYYKVLILVPGKPIRFGWRAVRNKGMRKMKTMIRERKRGSAGGEGTEPPRPTPLGGCEEDSQ